MPVAVTARRVRYRSAARAEFGETWRIPGLGGGAAHVRVSAAARPARRPGHLVRWPGSGHFGGSSRVDFGGAVAASGGVEELP